MSSDVARSWIFANLVPLLIAGVLAVAGFLLRKILGASAPDAAVSAKAVLVAFEIGASLLYFAVFPRMSGAVLRRIVPVLSQRGWLAVHLAMGLVAGIAFGLLMLEPDNNESLEWDGIGSVIFVVGVFAVGGALLGVVLGGLQAIVLRPAFGTRFWIGMSAVAMSTMAVLIVAPFSVMPAGSTLMAEIINAVVLTAVGTASGAMMLPALRRLQPRTAS